LAKGEGTTTARHEGRGKGRKLTREEGAESEPLAWVELRGEKGFKKRKVLGKKAVGGSVRASQAS